MKNIFKSLLHLLSHTKMGKLLPIIILSGLMATASAAVFTNYYAASTATVKTPDIQLVAGTDHTASPTSYPAATVTVASTKDSATIAFSLFPSATSTPQPATYYTNLTLIQNIGSGAHTIKSVTITPTSVNKLGNVTIFYCTSQTDTPSTGSLTSYVTLTSASTIGTPIAIPDVAGTSLAASGVNYIEIVGYASSTAVAADTATFSVSIQWA